MHSRPGIKFFAILLALVFTDQALALKKPNIIIIMADDLGFSDLGTYGATIIQTPHLDQLAAGGMRFTQFNNNAKCGPTRVGLMTGRAPHRVGLDGASGILNNSSLTLAEMLKGAGYNTMIAGKWHLAGGNAQVTDQFPLIRGFDEAYGLMTGASNFFNLEATNSNTFDASFIIDDELFYEYPDKPDYYVTNDYNNKAVEYIEKYAPREEPFFMYVSHQAPHLPIQAPAADIDKYRGKFMLGWDELRNNRYAKQLATGLFDESVVLSPRDAGIADWADATDKANWDLRMAAYAAMIEIIDRGVGMMVEKLVELGELDNTLIMFLSDNGGSAESGDKAGYDGEIGTIDSWPAIKKPWGNATNTPFLKYKSDVHEGGLNAPLIVSWPGVIKSPSLYRGLVHVKDIMPTLRQITQAPYPTQNLGATVIPYEGESMADLLVTGSKTPRSPLVVLYNNQSIVRQGSYKALDPGNGTWELYDLATDRTELNNVADENATLLNELISLQGDFKNDVDMVTAIPPMPAQLEISGCMDAGYSEFDSLATVEDNSECVTLATNSLPGNRKKIYFRGNHINIPGMLVSELRFRDLKGKYYIAPRTSPGVYRINSQMPAGVYFLESQENKESFLFFN